MLDLKPYPTMKDSGVRWLGEVPAGWDLRRNGRLFAERKETGFPDLPILEVSLKTGVRVRDFGLSERKQVMADREKYKRAASGDIAYNMMRMWQGAVGVAPTDGLVSPAYVVAQPLPGTVPGYFAYLYRTSAYMGEVNNYSHGIVADRNRLYWDEFKQIPTPYPPLDEQSAIVRFLDHADGCIRRYIRAKQKLIKLLEEQKRVIIHRAVTRGLDPKVRLKPSGVEWLGDVPEHWEVLPIKRAFVSMDYGISESATDEGTIRLLTMGNIKDGRVTIPETGGVTAVDPSLLIVAGDLLFNRTNSSELVGKVGLFRGANSAVTFASYLVRLRPPPEQEPEYLNLVLNDVSVLSIARREAIPSLHQSNLNPTRYGRLQISLPSISEQRAILQYLTAATSDLEKTVAAAHREVDLLREYRTRLIADAVTGKLDVREAAANLPAETEDSELPLAASELEEEPDVDLLDGYAELEE